MAWIQDGHSYDPADDWDAWRLRFDGFLMETLIGFEMDGHAIYHDTPAGYGWTVFGEDGTPSYFVRNVDLPMGGPLMTMPHIAYRRSPHHTVWGTAAYENQAREWEDTPDGPAYVVEDTRDWDGDGPHPDSLYGLSDEEAMR